MHNTLQLQLQKGTTKISKTEDRKYQASTHSSLAFLALSWLKQIETWQIKSFCDEKVFWFQSFLLELLIWYVDFRLLTLVRISRAFSLSFITNALIQSNDYQNREQTEEADSQATDLQATGLRLLLKERFYRKKRQFHHELSRYKRWTLIEFL